LCKVRAVLACDASDDRCFHFLFNEKLRLICTPLA
jgi:hypothetical protein